MEVIIMFCPNCGHKLPDGSSFCDNCGVKITLKADFSAEQPTENLSAKSAAALDQTDLYAADLSTKKTAGSSKKSKNAAAVSAKKTEKAAKKSSKKESYEWDDEDDEDEGSRAPLIIALLVAVIAIALIVVLFLRSGSFTMFTQNGSSGNSATITGTASAATDAAASSVPAVTATPTPTAAPTATPTPTAEPTPTPTPEQTKSDTYILSDSDSRILTDADLDGLSAEQVRYARNEILARHGYTFASEDLTSYFSGMSWYNPDPNLNADTDDLYGALGLNETEISNLTFIVEYEESHNYYN